MRQSFSLTFCVLVFQVCLRFFAGQPGFHPQDICIQRQSCACAWRVARRNNSNVGPVSQLKEETRNLNSLVFSPKQKKQEPSAAAAAGKCANKVAAAITAALIVSQRMAAGSVWQDAVGQTSVGSMGNWVLELVVSGAQLWEDSLDKTGSSALRFHNDDTHILGALSSFSTQEGRRKEGEQKEQKEL